MTAGWRVGIKVLLAAVTLLAIYGGLSFLFLPLGVGIWWMVRRSFRVERLAWVVLSGLAGAQWAWQITYPVTEGDAPSALIAATVGGLAAAALLTVASQYALTRDVPHSRRYRADPQPRRSADNARTRGRAHSPQSSGYSFLIDDVLSNTKPSRREVVDDGRTERFVGSGRSRRAARRGTAVRVSRRS
jgi:hypothetical protein